MCKRTSRKDMCLCACACVCISREYICISVLYVNSLQDFFLHVHMSYCQSNNTSRKPGWCRFSCIYIYIYTVYIYIYIYIFGLDRDSGSRCQTKSQKCFNVITWLCLPERSLLPSETAWQDSVLKMDWKSSNVNFLVGKKQKPRFTF